MPTSGALSKRPRSAPLPESLLYAWKTAPDLLAQHLTRGQYRCPPHLQFLSEMLVTLSTGRHGRLIVMLPPRHGKSETISHWFPVWLLEHDPTKRIILASHGATLAASFGRQVRNTIQNHADRLNVRLAEDQTAADHWETTAGGGMMTAGVGSSITGRGADVLIIDDPVQDAEQAASATYRDRAWDWWRSTAYTRLEPGGVAVLVQTRWHEDDLAGRILAQMHEGGERWDVLRLPAIAEGSDPLGRLPGEALWPERYSLDDFVRIRATTLDAPWESLYQQNPMPPGGTIFLREWFQSARYIPDPPRPWSQVAARYLSWDTAFKDTSSSAYTACVVGELTYDYKLEVKEVWRGKPGFPELPTIIRQMAERYNADGLLRGVVIEDKASGTSAYQTLRATAPAWLSDILVAYQPPGDKTQRANQAAVWCRNGSVLLPHPDPSVPWLLSFEDELFGFPRGAFADQVDAFDQLVLYLEHYLSAGHTARGGDGRVLVPETDSRVYPESRGRGEFATLFDR